MIMMHSNGELLYIDKQTKIYLSGEMSGQTIQRIVHSPTSEELLC